MGVAAKVRDYIPKISTDSEALEKAIEYNFTTGSQLHNKGMGLGNIRFACTGNDVLGIISNGSRLVK